MLANPWPTHTRLPLPLVLVNPSMSIMVMRDSMSPTPARMSEKGKIMIKVSRVNGGH